MIVSLYFDIIALLITCNYLGYSGYGTTCRCVEMLLTPHNMPSDCLEW